MKNINAVVQYLDWALLAAYAESHPDCDQITTVYDLVNKQCRTSYDLKKEKATKFERISLREAAVLRDLCERRIKDLEDKINDPSVYSLQPVIMAKKIQEIEAFFLKLIGFPLHDKAAGS